MRHKKVQGATVVPVLALATLFCSLAEHARLRLRSLPGAGGGGGLSLVSHQDPITRPKLARPRGKGRGMFGGGMGVVSEKWVGGSSLPAPSSSERKPWLEQSQGCVFL